MPARVTPQAPVVGTCDAVFGGSYGPVPATNGSSFTICCPVEGFPEPNITFHRLEVDRVTGLSREVLLDQNQTGIMVS